jgi:acetylornithine deacetylase/succinyl-diaminopimelate desuccinylase-like protein
MDSQALAEEALAHLKALVAFDTTNPPGNEMPAARYLDGVLEREGFEPVVIVGSPARQRGGATEGRRFGEAAPVVEPPGRGGGRGGGRLNS